MPPTITTGRAIHPASATHMHSCLRQRPLLINPASVLDRSMQMRAAIGSFRRCSGTQKIDSVGSDWRRFRQGETVSTKHCAVFGSRKPASIPVRGSGRRHLRGDLGPRQLRRG
mgnify:CR=1 FL=1